ncbi:acyltransferase [Rhodococcoides fascians A25f]|uniref:acyltransferase family protein n=1 Tax=Rhodococcoides fascians TaxID=1828 RepID=UPI00068A413A|nr:acyltransferase [Rhodococcus fascians]QII08111.1 acyltransferase [Rhodococcus fascians A25f]
MASNTTGKSAAGTAYQIPSLDGIRAIAVLTVFIGHGFTAPRIWPGHVGVTIFFFLSGYLITTLFRREREKTAQFAIGKFYLRRALRILPPAYVAIGASLAIAATGLIHTSVRPLGTYSEIFMFTNYYLVFQGREGLPPETSQLWSLAVEEHYYLIFPAFVLAALALKLSIRNLGWVIIGIATCVTFWRFYLWITTGDFFRLYVSTDTRFDVLLFGSGMALLANPVFSDPVPTWFRRNASRVIAPIALVIFSAVTLYQPYWFRLVWADLILVACMAPLFWTAIERPDGPITSWLNNKWIKKLGVLSFSIYLFHRLLLALIGDAISFGPIADLLSLFATIAVAQVVFLTVEKPCGRLRKRLEGKSRLTDSRNKGTHIDSE